MMKPTMENNDLISRSELLKSPIRITGTLGGKYPFEAISVAAIENALAVDAAPVVHGRWNVIVGNGWVDCKCNKCNHDWCGEEPPNYCENCGARMDGKDDEE